MRDLPPFGPPFLPPRFPISRITREIVSSFTSIVYRVAGRVNEVFACMLEALVVEGVMLEALLA
jgi:histone H3/H4